MATKKIVGKSIDVDISAEVSKAVKQELYALANGVSELVDSVKNTEILTANVAIAQSRSRLLTDAEKKSLQTLAKTAQDHAGKKVVSAPKIEVTAKEENKVAEEVAQKNMQYFNFDGVEKK